MGEKSRGNYSVDRRGMLILKMITEVRALAMIDKLDQDDLLELEDFIVKFVTDNCK